MDMVCAREPDSTHDFLRDPLELYVEDGFLRARGTTLGADDGVGVAYMLAVLADGSLPHPPLECVFTVQEEVGLGGAAALRAEDFRARRMLSLDDVGGGTSYVSAAGGQIVTFSRRVRRETAAAPAYRLRLGGLRGGHSGVDIEKERGNALRLLFRTLYALRGQDGLRLIGAEGGSASNAIPTAACASFVSAAPPEELRRRTEACRAAFRAELAGSDPGLSLELAPCPAAPAMTAEDSEDIVAFFRFLPDGFRHRSLELGGLTVASCNTGLLRTEDELVTAECNLRGALWSYVEEMEEEQAFLCARCGMTRRVDAVVPVFEYAGDSPLRAQLQKVFRQVTGRELRPVAVHGGLEAGYFRRMCPDMDIATVGPLVLDEHTPAERLSLASFDEIYRVLLAMLAAL